MLEDVDGAGDVDVEVVLGLIDAAGNGTEGGLMENQFAAGDGALEGGDVGDGTGDLLCDLAEAAEIFPVAAGEIVESDDLRIQFNQRLHEVRADEACAAGD